MQWLNQRFKQSNLTRAACYREEGTTAAQFTCWCQRLEEESNQKEVNPASITLAQVCTPIQAVKEPVERLLALKRPQILSSSTSRTNRQQHLLTRFLPSSLLYLW